MTLIAIVDIRYGVGDSCTPPIYHATIENELKSMYVYWFDSPPSLIW